MPHFFRIEEAMGDDFTTQFRFRGDGAGEWVLRIQRGRAEVRTGTAESPDLVVECEGRTFLEVQQGTRSAAWSLATGRIRLSGNRRLFLRFPSMFALDPAEGPVARVAWRARRWLRAKRGATPPKQVR
jgi:putative sterol carrier protein